MKKAIFYFFFLTVVVTMTAKETVQSVKVDYYLQQARNGKLPFENRAAFYDSLTKAYGQNVPFEVKCEQASLYEKEGLYINALSIYREAASTVSKDNLKDYSHLLLNTAISAYHSNRMREAISNIYELETIESPDSLRHYNMDGYRLLGFITSSVKNSDLAKKYLDLAWKEYARASASSTESEKNRMLCRLHFAKSEMYMNLGENEKALQQLREAKALSPDSLVMADICGSLGRLCDAEGDATAAEEFYKEALSLIDTHPNRVISVGNYVSLLLAQKRINEAKALMNQNEPLFQVFKGANVERYVELLRYSVARAEGNKDKALESLERLHLLDDSIKNSQSSVYIKDIIAEFEDKKKDDLQHEMEIESRRKTTLIAILILILAGAGIFAGVMWSRQRKRTNEKQLLESKLSDIDDENKKRQKVMEENVEMCNKEMMTMSMHAKKTQESLEKMSNLIKEKTLRPDEKIGKIESLLSKMSAQNNVHKMFGIYFSRVNRVFFDRLFRLHPDLTQGEIRLCGYMQIGLSSKEIATLTNRSVRTVDNIKYNLRKKLGISEQTESYIRRISSCSDKEIAGMISHRNESQIQESTV